MIGAGQGEIRICCWVPEVEMGYASLFFAQGDKVKARQHLEKAKQSLERMGIRMWDWEARRLEQAMG